MTMSLLTRYEELGRADWRTWNLSRMRARHAIEKNIFGLREAACPQIYPSPLERSID
jgi:hypothetical protein